MEEFKKDLDSLAEQLGNLKNVLRIEDKSADIARLQEKMSATDFWQDQSSANEVVSRLKPLKNDVDDWNSLNKKFTELKDLTVIADDSYAAEIKKEIGELQEGCRVLNLRTLFFEKLDASSAIVEINSGAGGTEACDWASILYRMYFRWAEDKKFKLSVFTEVPGEEAGTKNIAFLIEGLRAYGMLKAERGVHRLVRISPFDANKRRHTSFASVDVLPQITGDIDIEIRPEDLKIDTFRSGGAGGQHVNKTESAIRITHLPSGIIVGCQCERSQHQNKQVALNILKAKLYERREEQRKNELNKIAGHKQKIEWGSQIRSYVLHPYLLVKDHRTDWETSQAIKVLDGGLDDFIYAYLKMMAQEANTART
jgi:peptide chain release factor 2